MTASIMDAPLVGTVKVSVVTEREANIINFSNTVTAEDLCIRLCKKLKIPPLTRFLFALRIKGSNNFMKDNACVLSGKRDYVLRIRFMVPRLYYLITLDEITFDYYYQQARNDVNENKIPEIKYPDHKEELLGLGIADMVRALLEEENMTLKVVERNYKKFIPKVILKKHGQVTKKHAHEIIPKICSRKPKVTFVKEQYLLQLYNLAPNYLSEEFDGVILQDGSTLTPVKLVVAPFHPNQPGIRMYDTPKREWVHLCTMEDLIYFTRNGNNSIEVSRRGTPLFFTFVSEEQLSSFISLCDGYYRLMVKWTFNLSKDDETPSLKKLQTIKCHGPVGGAFSYRKLEEKRGKKHGCYILRQCQDEYDVFYLDVCTKNRTTETYKLEFKGDCYVFNNAQYGSIKELVEKHRDPEGRIYMKECIPPSEYDKSQLLLCGEPEKKGVRIDQAELQEILKDNKSPRCLLNKDIWLYQGSEKFGRTGLIATYKALWKLDDTKKLLVAFKTLQKERAEDYLKDFMEIANKWACVNSSSIVRLYGVTLSSPTAMVLEYLPYGPFDKYLRDNRERIKPLQLKKVAVSLACALWDLSEAGVVHGYIRCRNLLLAAQDSERMVVKLSGPKLHQYTEDDVHWIPVDFYSDMSLAKRSVLGDIWAFATTVWEVFSFGLSPADRNPVFTALSYERGDRLHRPPQCPREVWDLISMCWEKDPPRPQEIMRDMNHMLYQEYIPSRPHYEDIIQHCPPEMSDTDTFITSEPSDAGSNKSLISLDSNSYNGSDQYDNSFGGSKSSVESLNTQLVHALRSMDRYKDDSCNNIINDNGGASIGGLDDDDACSSPRLMESIVSQGKCFLLTLMHKIGSGNYGHVYRGYMESDNQESERKQVAVKKLTRKSSETTHFDDFRNELSIMKSLQHVNVVEILGYSCDHGSDVLIVMEYLEEGALNQYLKHQGHKLKRRDLLKYALDIASGMDHISAKNIVHRDLAARNILVVNRSNVKISDFGLARILPKEENAYKLKTERYLPINWYAPESAVEPWSFSTKSDVWSYGVTVWEIFNRCSVEVPKFDIERPKERGSCFQIPKDCPSEVFVHLMKDCWDLEPGKRPKFIDLVLKCKGFLSEYNTTRY